MKKHQASSKDESGTGRQQVAAERGGWAVGGPESSQIPRKAQEDWAARQARASWEAGAPGRPGRGLPGWRGLAHECGEMAFSVGVLGSMEGC